MENHAVAIMPEFRHTPLLRCLGALLGFALLASCANFRKLGKDLKLIDEQYRISGVIANTHSQKAPVRAVVVEWDPQTNEVYSGDRLDLTQGGAFAFIVKSPINQYVAAYADNNHNGKYDLGEPAWIYRGKNGKPAAVELGHDHRVVNVSGRLSSAEHFPKSLIVAVERMLAGRQVSECISRQGVVFALGETADLDDPRFAATRGEDGLWTPATFAIQNGCGIYFLKPYDPGKIPVLFVHGAAGSPQDWRKAMDTLDSRRYQAWFYVYPSGMRLDNAASALDRGVRLLHDRYGFKRLHVVAHSMGGLVARSFIVKNVIEGGNGYINTFVSVSSPWNGHEAAAMGVKYAPEVVPSWIDMKHGSDFLTHLFDHPLKSRVSHHLLYGHRAKRSPILPEENDGVVSVASETRKEARADAVEVQGYNEDHLSILTAPDTLAKLRGILDQAPR